MKRGVKACDLRHPRHQPGASAYSRKVMRLMQRRERHQLRELLHHFVVDADRRSEAGPAMYDTVTDCVERPLSVLARDPSEKLVEKIFVCELGAVLTELLSAMVSPPGTRTFRCGAVPIFSKSPRKSSESSVLDSQCHTENLTLDEPALRVRILPAVTRGLLSIMVQSPARAAVL